MGAEPSSRATVRDVARLAGVSAKTVSRVFRAEPHVSPETRDRILESARRLHFRPNDIARNLRLGAVSTTVAYVIGDLMNPFYFAVAAGIERELASEGHTMILASTEDDPTQEQRVTDALIAQRIRALIMVPIAHDQSHLEGEKQLGLPIVAVDRPAVNLAADAVLLDNTSGMRQATEELLRVGHHRIGFVANPPDIFSHMERLHGYRDAMHAAGVEDTSLWERLSNDQVRTPEEETLDLLALPDPPTAIVTGNNRATEGALRAIRTTGARVGLIGFDDFPLAQTLGISVVSFDPQDMGRRAARLALDRLVIPEGVPVEQRAPVSLVLRGSEIQGVPA